MLFARTCGVLIIVWLRSLPQQNTYPCALRPQPRPTNELFSSSLIPIDVYTPAGKLVRPVRMERDGGPQQATVPSVLRPQAITPSCTTAGITQPPERQVPVPALTVHAIP